jgi:UDP-glucose 4-epimerase
MTSSLDGRKIMVTGASGFLGSNLTNRLLQIGADVHAVSRSQRNAGSNGLRWWQADLADIDGTRDVLTKVRPDVIYHFAGLSTADPDFHLVLPILNSLLISTVNVLTAATEIGQSRIILAASLTEPELAHTSATPGSPYAAAKWASGGYARMFHRLYQLPVVMVRPFMTYGPGQDHRKIIPYVILSLLREEAPKLSSGNQEFDWIYIDDVVDGLVAAAEVYGVEGCTIDLGSGTLTSVRTVIQKIARLVGSPAELVFGTLPDRPFERRRIANLAEANSKLGWRPKVSIEKGLEQTVSWYKEQALNALPMKSLVSTGGS